MTNKIISTAGAFLAVALSSSALAADLDIKAHGLLNFQAGANHQKKIYKKGITNFNRDLAFFENAKVSVSAIGKSAGLTYGAVVSLAANINQNNNTSDKNFDRTHIFLESGMGRVELGSNYSASKSLGIDGGSAAVATGGIGGDWANFVNQGVPGATFVTSTDTFADAGEGDRESAMKVTYYSPRYSGFQFGVSFTPDFSNTGTNSVFASGGRLAVKNLFDLGVNYTQNIDNVSLGLSATGQFGKAGTLNDVGASTKRDVKSYAFGASVGYAGFTVAGNIGTYEKSLATKAVRTSDTDFWSLGAGYKQGPAGVSVSYMESKNQHNDFNNLVLGAEYEMLKGMTAYAETSFFDFKAARALNQPKNNGNAFLLGTIIKF